MYAVIKKSPFVYILPMNSNDKQPDLLLALSTLIEWQGAFVR